MTRLLPTALFLTFLSIWPITAAQHPRDQELRDKEIHDPDTLAWWHTTEALSSDAMEGRDTGSPAYQRAADYVAQRFRAAGLSPGAGQGSYFQTVAFHEVAVEPAGTTFLLHRDAGPPLPLHFLEEITLTPAEDLPLHTSATLAFRGYCDKAAMTGVAGKIAVCFGTQRKGLPSGAERLANARAANAAGLLVVDDPYFTIEPPRWPYAYARTVSLAKPDPPPPPPIHPLLVMRLAAASFAALLQGTGKDANSILQSGGQQQPLPSFDIPASLQVQLHLSQRSYTSPNVLGILPGTDPSLSKQYVVIAAHLDGYGHGTPVHGDSLYNGTLDDAAYVALLIQFAEDLKRAHRPLQRSVLFCAFTGEEKGLFGSTYFVAHPTVPPGSLVADINLDQLRPLFPLKILTALALDDSTLGPTAATLGTSMGIELRPDREPERRLLERADHYPFLKNSIPAIGFIFGYDPGTEAEQRYREWYQARYHRPQDDLTQPVDFDAAAKFDQFFYRLVETVADQPARPAFQKGSRFAAVAAAPAAQ